jgi:TetR/AcrR family transcriptional regulator, copper-responsive repressor
MQGLFVVSDTEIKRRGRPRSFDREAAIAVALDLFWDLGYDNTSLSQLTEAMGINPPSFYAAFESKEALFIQILDHYHQPFYEWAEKRLAKGGPTAKAFTGLISDIAKSHTQNETLRGCLIVNSGLLVHRVDSPIADRIRMLVTKNELLFFERLQQGKKSGDVGRSVDSREMAIYINGLIHSMASIGRTTQLPAAVRAIARVGNASLIQWLA